MANAVQLADENGAQYTGVNPLPVGSSVGGAAVSATNPLPIGFGNDKYETVAASQTAQALGAAGAIGDYLMGLLVIPATTTPGLVTILDNAISIPVFVGGADSTLGDLRPFFVPVGAKSVSGAWKVTTGANVSVLAIGQFT